VVSTNGSNTVFTVTAIGNGVLLRYQWSQNGTNLTDGTNATLTLNNLELRHEGTYWVTVADDANTVTSDSATLQVLLKPVIIRGPASQIVMAGASFTLSLEATGTTPLYYRWRRSGSTIGNTVDTPVFTVTNLQAASVGAYTVVVTNRANGVGVISTPPAILTVVTNFPTNKVVHPGANVIFTVGAVGLSPISYQWLFNNANLAGETNTSLARNNVQYTNDGIYSVSVMTSNAQLNIPAFLAVLRQPVLGTVRMSPNGQLLLQLDGNERVNYRVEASTNFRDWSEVGAFAHTNGLPISLPLATNSFLRFYRLRLDPTQ
jgi:hypothetical protein